MGPAERRATLSKHLGCGSEVDPHGLRQSPEFDRERGVEENGVHRRKYRLRAIFRQWRYSAEPIVRKPLSGVGDPASISFCGRIGLTYVSCSPYRVPIARLAAAQAALNSDTVKRD